MIYFIKCHSTVKIGYSDMDDIKDRLYALQISSPFELVIMKTIDGSRLLEKAFHAVFKDYSIRGEWFELSDKLVQFINNIPSGKDNFSILEKDIQSLKRSFIKPIKGLCEYCNRPLDKGPKSKKYCSKLCRWSAWSNRNPRITTNPLKEIKND